MPDRDLPARVLFISHTAVDQPYAVALCSAVEALAGPRAIDVRYSSNAASGPQGGQVWREWIDSRIEDFWSALIVVTPESMGKPWLLWEAGACHAAKLLESARDEPGRWRKIVPIAFGLARSECPDPLLGEQVVDGTDPAGMEQLFIDLLAHHGIHRPATIRAADEMREVLDGYLGAARSALLRMPSLVNEANVREWLDRLDRFGPERASELPGFERWMHLAFGRDGEAAGVPIDVRLHRRLGELYLGLRDYDGAMRQLNLARRAAPRDIYVLRPLGEAGMKRYLELGEAGRDEDADSFREEVDAVMAAISDLDDDAYCSNPDTAALFGKYQRLALGDLDGAIATFSVALERNTDSYYLADVLGQAQLEAGQLDDARATYRRAIDILDALAAAGEQNVWTRATHATASLVCGETEMAAQHLAAVGESDDVTPSVLDSIASGVRTVAARIELDPSRTEQLVDRLFGDSAAAGAPGG
jgi:tetratricopeptide (TPR) repeat protein